MDYGLVLEPYGGTTLSGSMNYVMQIEEDLSKDITFKSKIIGQSILGDESFVEWVSDNILEKTKDREQPSLSKIQSYVSCGRILRKHSQNHRKNS